MKFLFLHQNFPGQFRHLAGWLAANGHPVVALAREQAPGMAGVRLLRYKPQREAAAQTHPWLRGFENGVLHGQAVARILHRLKAQGFAPDVVVAHPGWGEALFVKDVFPRARVVHFCEYYYRETGADVGFDPEFPPDADTGPRIRTRNALHLLNLEQCDAAIAPTRWQRDLHPAAYRERIVVAHEGIDTDLLRPDPQATFALADGRVLRAGDEVVTYVARNLEPYRGFPSFMRALPALLAARPRAQVVVVGGDEVSYGRRPEGAANWRGKLLAEVAIDPARVHFAGKIPYADYRRLLQVSAAHVYLTYPFVLSWSVLEAMSSGCVVVGSDTAPVREVVEHDRNGLLVDFFDPAAIAATVADVLARPREYAPLRVAARATAVAGYGVDAGLRAWLDVLGVDPVTAVTTPARASG